MCFLLKQKEVFRLSMCVREIEREREIFTDFYQYSHDCKHAYKAMASPEKYLGYRCHFYFFSFSTSNTKIKIHISLTEKEMYRS